MDCDGKCLSQVVVCCESCGKEVLVAAKIQVMKVLRVYVTNAMRMRDFF